MSTVYEIEIGDEIIEFEGPDNLTENQIEDLAQKELKKAKPGRSFIRPVYAGVAEPPARAEDESSAAGAFLRNLPAEALFNFDDELVAWGNANVPGLAWLDRFITGSDQQYGDEAGNLEDYREQRAADEELHPAASATGKIAGVLSTLPKAGITVASKLPMALRSAAASRPVLTTSALGGTAGAASGAGAGEEGTRAQSAAIAGLTGFGLGPAGYAAAELAPIIGNYVKIFFNKGSTKEAVQQIVKALERDGFDVTSPAAVQSLRDTLQEFSGKPVSLADIGSATRSRAGVALRAPSNVQQQSIDKIRSRQAGQGQRLATDIRQTVAPRTDVHAIDEELVAQRASEAERLRERALFEQVADPAAALEDGVARTVAREITPISEGAVAAGGRQSRIVNDPTLQQLARLPDTQKALQGAVARAESERALRATMGEDISDIPDINLGSDLDVRTFDYLKRFLDDEVNKLYRGADTQTFKAAQAAQVKALRDAIRERLRTAVPEYGDYLDAYRGSSEMIDSLEAGRTFDRLDPEQIAREQGQRSTAAQELYRVGAARNLLDVIRETGDNANAATRLLPSEEARNQLLATGVDPNAATRLNRSIAQERVLNLLPLELSGSQTAQRAAAQADANAGVDLAIPFNPASAISWPAMLGRKVLEHTSINRNAAVNAELLPRLLETNPQAINGIIDELERQGKIAEAFALRRKVASMHGSFTGGALIGSPVALEAE